MWRAPLNRLASALSISLHSWGTSWTTATAGECGTWRSKHGVRVRCIGSDPRRAHGRTPVLILADEPAQCQTTRATAWLQLLAPPPGSNHTVFSWHWGRNQHPNIIGFPSGYAAVLTMRSSTRRATVTPSFSGAHGARQTQALTTCQTVLEEALDTDHELTGFVRTRGFMSS